MTPGYSTKDNSGIIMRAIITILCAMFLLPTVSLAEGKKYALLVGVAKYDPSQLNRLQFAEDDATEMGKVLEKLGFEVVVMTAQQSVPERVPVTAQDILDQVERRLKDKQPEDTVLLSFSGHGVQLKSDPADEKGAKETYFCPQRAKLGDKSTLVPMSVVMSMLDKCPATRKLLLVDACRNEAESKDAAKTTEIELEPAGVTRRSVPQGMVVLFSCQARERSYEMSELKHSAFTFHVLKYLKGEAPLTRYPRRQASITELASYVSRETKDFIDRKLSKDQQPEFLSPGGAADWELGKVQRTTVTVSATDRSADFPTITEALKEVSPGGTIRVQPGQYLEGLVLDKPVTILGNGDPKGIIVESTKGHCVQMATTTATIKGLTLQCRAKDVSKQYAVELSQGRLTVEDCDLTSSSHTGAKISGEMAFGEFRNCRFLNSVKSGIWVNDSAKAHIEDCDIFGNNGPGVSITAKADPMVRKCRIHDGRGQGVAVTDDGRGTIEDCAIYGNARAGIQIQAKADPVIRKCRIHDGKFSGVFVAQEGRGTIDDCEIYGNASVGVGITTKADPIVHKCRIHDQKYEGVSVREEGRGTIDGCEIYGNVSAGVRVVERGKPTISGCTIRRNGYQAIALDGTSMATVRNSDLRTNTRSSLGYESGASVTQSGNLTD